MTVKAEASSAEAANPRARKGGNSIYDSIMCVQRYLGARLGDWNDEKGRTVGDVVDALRGAALFS